MRHSNFLFLLLYVFIPALSFSQKIDFEHLSVKDGLVHNSVTAIIKDSYGYMWFGTYNGLSRYDGYTFTNYVNNPLDTTSLSCNPVHCLMESADKKLYIGTSTAGFCIFDREKETFKRFLHNPGDANSLNDNEVMAIYQDSKGNIWIGTKSGLNKFDSKTGRFRHYNPEREKNYFISSISEDKEGNLWLYGRGDHVYKFDPSRGTFRKIIFNDNFKSSFCLGGMLLCDSKGSIWIGSEGSGLCRFNLSDSSKVWYSEKNKKIRSDIVRSIIEDSNGRIWIGTDGGGVDIYDYGKDSFIYLMNDPQDPNSLSANGVYTIYESQPGQIWVGVFSEGINIYKRDKKKFEKFSIYGPEHCRPSFKSIVDMAERKDGKIWIGTDGGGLNLFDPETRYFTHYSPENSIIPFHKSLSVFQDNEDNLWLGSYGKGLCKINPEKRKIKLYPGNINARGETICGSNVWNIVQTSDKKIWIGLLNYGINVYDPEKDRFTYYPVDTATYNRASSSIYIILEDRKKRVWVGTQEAGAGYFDPGKNAFVLFRNDPHRRGSLSSNFVREIFEDSRGNIWIGTVKGGLNKLINFEKGEFETYTTKDGLASNNIQKILEDDHGNLWISTENGLSLFKVAERKFINFDIEDGLQDMAFNWNSALKGRNGYMYFGGPKGLNMFHPDSVRFNTTPPVVALTDFKIFNKSIVPGKAYNGKVYLHTAIGLEKEIILTDKEFIFSIDFAALDFNSPKKNRYAYRLLGFDEHWTYVNADKRFASYMNLQPGKYTFQVIACNNDGVWNMKGASIKIIILPPFWKTWWFRSLSIMLVVLLVVFIYYLRMRAIREKNKFLENEVKRRTAELKEANEHLAHLNKTKDKFFSIIGHDLKGPVRALTSITELLKEESASMVNDRQKALAAHAHTASVKVQNLVLSLLEWARTQSRQIKVEPVLVEVPRLFKETVEALSEQATQKELQIEIHSDDTHIIWGDYNMIATVVRNILSNSIKYTPRGGKILLSSNPDKEHIRLSISDTGVGMSPEILNNLFSLNKNVSEKGTENEIGTGLGMIISQEFVQLNNGRIYVESTPGKGSTFYVILPIANSRTVKS